MFLTFRYNLVLFSIFQYHLEVLYSQKFFQSEIKTYVLLENFEAF